LQEEPVSYSRFNDRELATPLPHPRATPPIVVVAAAAAAGGYSTNAISSPIIWPRTAAAALVRIPPQQGMQQQQQQPNVIPRGRLRVCQCVCGAAAPFWVLPRTQLSPALSCITRPDPTRAKFLLPTTRYYFSLLPPTPIFYCCYFPPTCFDWLYKTINFPLLVLRFFIHLSFILFYHSYLLCIYYLLSLFLLLLLFTHLL